MNQYGVERPMGLDNLCREIEKVCAKASAYSSTKPGNYIIRLDAGNGRTTLVEYAADMYKKAEVLDFSSSRDAYIKVTVDTTVKTFRKCKEAIMDVAEYKNYYEGIIEADVTELVSHMGEGQYKELYKDFFSYFAEVSKHACVFFFVPEQLTKMGEKFVDDVQKNIKGVKYIAADPYTKKDLAEIVKKEVCYYGVEIPDTMDAFLYSAVEQHEIKTVPDAVSFAKLLVKCADFDNRIPVIDEKCLGMLAETETVTEKSKGEKHEQK